MKLNEVFTPLYEKEDLFAKYDAEIRAYFEKGTFIYRGMPTVIPAILGDGSTVNRVASETYNFVNMLVSEILPEWKKFPPRNKSFICATDERTAKVYGKPYHIIPLENQDIGICPKFDFWKCFQFDGRRVSVDVLNTVIYKFTELNGDLGNMQDPHRIIELLELCDKNKGNAKYQHSSDFIVGSISEYNGSTLDFCKMVLDPDKNGFEVKKFSSFSPAPESRHEVWLTGKVLMVNSNLAEDYMKGKPDEAQ